jgi:hypothetical protein
MADSDELAIAQQQLIEVRAAISAALLNQSTTVQGRTFTKSPLNDLRAQEKDLLTRISRLSAAIAGSGRRAQRVYPL